MNPFTLQCPPIEKTFLTWQQLDVKPYDKHTVDPYTRTRVILMNGTEFENVWFSHQFSRNCPDNHLRGQLAMLRKSEQFQQKLLATLKPTDENVLEHTIGYEQLAVDLTAHLALREQDEQVRSALNFALLEDFDHLYRYANYLDMQDGIHAEDLVGRYTEIMPARPTIAHHRCPLDDIKNPITSAADLQTKLCVGIITAAEQQTMNYYMNLSAAYPHAPGRALYREIGMVEEQHVSQYGSLMDVNSTWCQNLLMHQYIECYLYYSCWQTETDPRIKQLWQQLFEMELAHLHLAAEILQQQEGTHYSQVVGDGNFPQPLRLESNIDHVRCVLGQTVQFTGCRDSYTPVENLPQDADFYRYQKAIQPDDNQVASHRVIVDYLAHHPQDYRYEQAPNPIVPLRDRTCDNTRVGRCPHADQA